MNEEATVDDNLLTLPIDAGRAIVETGAVIACPLLGTDRFLTYCRERRMAIDRERLIRLEHLGLFAPVFRVRTPDEDLPPFRIPVRDTKNWFNKKWALDTTSLARDYDVPNPHDQE